MDNNDQNKDKVLNTSAENFICTNCGGVIRFNINSQKFMCSSCREEKETDAVMEFIKERNFNEYRQREQESVPFEGFAVCTCQNCGLDIMFSERQVSATCPMCSSSQFAEIKQKAGIAPDGIIPFQIDKNHAGKMFGNWVKSRWFAPGDFKKKCGEGNLKGMYLPFWTYDASVTSSYAGQGGTVKVKSKNGKKVTTTEWHKVSGVVASNFDDVLIFAGDNEDNIRSILPYGTTSSNLKPYSPSYLSGYYAEIYKLKADECLESAKAIMDNQMRKKAASDIRKKYDVAKVSTLNSSYRNITYKHVLLPLWSSAYSYNGQIYSYLINGETGCVSGDRPYSKFKIAMLIAVIAVVVTVFCVIAVNSDILEELYPENVGLNDGRYSYGLTLADSRQNYHYTYKQEEAEWVF